LALREVFPPDLASHLAPGVAMAYSSLISNGAKGAIEALT
jgi:hypothetical protein